MGERDDARHQVEQKRERMSRIAYEVSRRMTPRYAKERAREMARDTMLGARDRAVENRWFAPLIGAGVGALVARALKSRAQERGWERDRFGGRGELEGGMYGYPRSGLPGYAAGHEEYDVYRGAASMPEEARAGDVTGEEASGGLGEKASEVKERARAKAEQVKGRIQETAASVRERLPDREQLRESTHEDTALWALGAMALGALFGFALPETQREREMLEPARRKAREIGQQARDKVLEKGAEAMDKATEKVASVGAEQRPGAAGAPPSSEPPPALH